MEGWYLLGLFHKQAANLNLKMNPVDAVSATKALNALENAVRCDSHCAYVWNSKAIMQLALGRVKESKESLLLALSLDPTNSLFRNNLKRLVGTHSPAIGKRCLTAASTILPMCFPICRKSIFLCIFLPSWTSNYHDLAMTLADCLQIESLVLWL